MLEKPTEMQRRALLMKRCVLFSGLDDDQLAQLSRITLAKSYEKGQVIFMEGRPADGFYLLTAGRVKLYKLAPDGKEQILRIVGPGETFAEAAVFAGETYPAFAEALKPSEALFFHKRDFTQLVEGNPQLALNMIAALSRLLRQLTQLVEDLSLKDVSARLAKYLLDLSARSSKPGQVKLDLSKAQLAARLGTIGETLSRTLAKLKARGILDVSGRTITLLDRRGLEDAAAGGKPVP